ncbi:MAG: hypothetical protein K2W96_08970 [Gemmataceae bacterium]|nr:hypothetical protein [Gemmataceae bacterium]
MDERLGTLFKGAAGQCAVLSEFLYRLMNVAVPEVDIGDDIFVVTEKDETVTRVQAKHAKAEAQANGSWVAQFMLPWEQFFHDDTPPLVYVLAVRFNDQWNDFIVVRRSVLVEMHRRNPIGSNATDTSGTATGVKLRLVFTEGDVKCQGKQSLQVFRGAFTPWPPPEAVQETR